MSTTDARGMQVALSLAAAAALLAGCGQKGALYLPPKPGAVVTSAPTPPAPPATQSQPPQVAPAPAPQSTPAPEPSSNPPPPKKPDPDSDSQSPK